MSITTDSLAEFVDRLADLKRALAQLNDAGTADRHLIGLETVANAARALFDDDKPSSCTTRPTTPTTTISRLSRPWSSLRVGGTLRQCLAVWFVQGWYPFAPRPSLS